MLANFELWFWLGAPFKDDFLLDKDDPHVQAELLRLQAHSAKSVLGTGGSSDKSQGWVKMHMNLAEKRGIPWPIKCSPKVAASPWHDVLPSRQREVL